MTNKITYDLSTFSKEGKIEDVKIGTKIWFKDEYETDVGIVVTEEEYRVKANWNSGLVLSVYKKGFNDYWGIIAENKQQQNRHKYYDVILHWANGGEIQSKRRYDNEDKWVTFKSDGVYSPAFSHSDFNWRIKPKTKTLCYRNALLKNNQIVVFTSVPTLEDAYGDTAFLRWIDPEWKEIKVEI